MEEQIPTDCRNSSCYIDPDEDEIFVGPITKTEISRISECHLEEFVSLSVSGLSTFNSSPQKSELDDKSNLADVSNNESNSTCSKESPRFRPEPSDHTSVNKLSNDTDEACVSHLSENAHCYSLCDEESQANAESANDNHHQESTSLQPASSDHMTINEPSNNEDEAVIIYLSENDHCDSLYNEEGQADALQYSEESVSDNHRNSDSGCIVVDEGETSLLCEGMFTTSFETTFDSDSPLRYPKEGKVNPQSSINKSCYSETDHVGIMEDKLKEENCLIYLSQDKLNAENMDNSNKEIMITKDNINIDEENSQNFLIKDVDVAETPSFTDNCSEGSPLKSSHDSMNNSGPKYFDEIDAILEFQKQINQKNEIPVENQSFEVNDQNAVKYNRAPSSVLPDIPVKIKANDQGKTKNFSRIPQFRSACRIPKPKIVEPKVLKAKNTPRKPSKTYSDFQSPVAQYIHENPTPPLIRNFRANGQLSFPKSFAKTKLPQKKQVESNKENVRKPTAVKVMKNQSEKKLSLKPVLPVTEYKLKKNINKEVNWDEITKKNTQQNHNTRQYFPSPTIVKHKGASKVITWAKHLEIKDNNCDNQTPNLSAEDCSSARNSSEHHRLSSLDGTVIDVHCSARTDTLSKN